MIWIFANPQVLLVEICKHNCYTQKKMIKRAENYRPISLTSVVCKIMESIVRDAIMNNMKINNFFSNKQFGFLSGRLTTLQLLKVLADWTEALDNGHIIDIIYTDFQKPFDSVPHTRLISKIKVMVLRATC